MWSKNENDVRCREFARNISREFKNEIQRQDGQSSKGIEGGASIRGKKGAVMLYGGYDVSQTPTCDPRTMELIEP